MGSAQAASETAEVRVPPAGRPPDTDLQSAPERQANPALGADQGLDRFEVSSFSSFHRVMSPVHERITPVRFFDISFGALGEVTVDIAHDLPHVIEVSFRQVISLLVEQLYDPTT